MSMCWGDWCPNGCEECSWWRFPTKEQRREMERLEFERQEEEKLKKQKERLTLLEGFRLLREENKTTKEYSEIWIESKIKKLENDNY
jgi:hypothetical protein